MSEIKGQLLGLVLVLVIFAAVSAGLATVFTSTAGQITTKSENIDTSIETFMAED